MGLDKTFSLKIVEKDLGFYPLDRDYSVFNPYRLLWPIKEPPPCKMSCPKLYGQRKKSPLVGKIKF